MNNTESKFNLGNNFTYSEVTSPTELDELVNYSASYENLNFGFSEQYIEKLKSMLHEPNAFQEMVRSDSGEFAGYVAASEQLFPNNLFLTELFINPAYNGKGLGTELVNKVIDSAKSSGLQGVITQTEHENIPAQKLYEKLGFKPIRNPNSQHITYELKFTENTP